MGKELQVSLGVIGVLLMLFLAMVYQRFFLNSPHGEPVRAVINAVDSPETTHTIKSHPTIVKDPSPAEESVDNPRQNPRNPRNPRPIDAGDSSATSYEANAVRPGVSSTRQ